MNNATAKQPELIERNGFITYIDEFGIEITPRVYTDGHFFKNGTARVKRNGKWGIIDTEGNEIIPCKYDWVRNFQEDLAAVESNGKCGFANRKGEIVIPLIWGMVRDFSEGLAGVYHDSVEHFAGFVDHTGRLVKDWTGKPWFPVGPFRNGIIKVADINCNVRYADPDGNLVSR